MRDEILAYFHNVAHQYDLAKHTHLEHIVQKATWHSKTNTWLVEILDVKNKREIQRRCKVLVSAVGALSVPKKCTIPGHEDFQGKLFHSAAWDHSFDYTDKDIIVLGLFH